MPCANANPSVFTLDKALPILHLRVAYSDLYVHRYPKGSELPAGVWDGGFVSVTKTEEEVSIVANKLEGSEECGGPWVAVRVKGPLEHHMVGVLSELARVLKEASVSIFAISTWDTDYLLVTTGTLPAARSALEADGWIFDE